MSSWLKKAAAISFAVAIVPLLNGCCCLNHHRAAPCGPCGPPACATGYQQQIQPAYAARGPVACNCGPTTAPY